MRSQGYTKSFQALLLITSIVFCKASIAADYKSFIKDNFWEGLYKNGGETFFCKKPFTKKTPLLALSYIYASTQIRDHLECGTNRQCLRSDHQYVEIISDLHNIVPANSYFEFKRKHAQFGNLDETIEANECGIRKKLHIIEPPDSLKGDVARVLFYMHNRYKLPLQAHVSLLRLWNENDPPSAEEQKRNTKISELQGNENEFVSNPSLANNIE